MWGGYREGLAKLAVGSRNGGLAKIRHRVLLDLQNRPMGPTCNIPNFASPSEVCPTSGDESSMVQRARQRGRRLLSLAVTGEVMTAFRILLLIGIAGVAGAQKVDTV